MAETNIAYATDSTVFPALEALVLHNLPNFGEGGDGIINNNFLFSMLKRSGSLNVVGGGLEFWHPIMIAENTNAKWQVHTASMTANLQDPERRLRFPIRTFTDSIVYNALHKAMNQGREMVKSWQRTLTKQAESTIPNRFNSAFWNTSPGSSEPESLPSMFTTTPTTGTIGGLTRSSYSALQHGHDSTSVTDMGSEDGIKQLMLNVKEQAVGSGGKSGVDTVIMAHTRYVSLEAYLASLNRYRPDDKMAQLGFDTIKYSQVTISYENRNIRDVSQNTITENYAYGINSKHLFLSVLKDGNFKWEPRFERVGQTMNRALYFRVFCNLTTNLPAAHFLMSSITG